MARIYGTSHYTGTLVITGPTATGKTRLAVELSRAYNGEIISADCRQVYRGLDMGTGKDLADYGTPPDDIPYHLIDVVEPNQEFHLLKFLQMATEAIDDIRSRGGLPVVAGGTPLYVNALLNGYEMPGGQPDPEFRATLGDKTTDELVAMLKAMADSELFNRADLTQRRRIIRAIEIARNPQATVTASPIPNPLILAPFYDRQTVRKRIEIRLDQRLEAGMVDEVAALHDNGVGWDRLEWYGLEYRHIARYLQGLVSYDQMREELLNKIRSFAKSQDIWFRKLEREGHVIHWLPDGNPEQAKELVELWLAGKTLPPPKIILNDIHYGKLS